MSEIVKEIRQAVVKYQKDKIPGMVQNALDQGIEPQTIINDALIGAMDQVGKEFSQGIIFVPEMLVAAMSMKEGLNVVTPYLKTEDRSKKGTVLLCTVKGDMHDIGKNIVGMMIESVGYKVVDMGVDLTSERIIEGLEAHQPIALGLSALLTTTMPEMEHVLNELQQRGWRDKVKVLVGGAPMDQKFADKIGADGYGRDAAQAVEILRSFSS